MWCGRQAAALGLSGTVGVEALEESLSGRDPVSGTRLGRELVDRVTADGRTIRAVSGFDATFSAPKALSVWWALTGDARLLEAHDVAVAAALQYLERFGSTTRIRSNGGRLHPDSGGLTMATFRQTTSRADDPQIHTHAVISAKVQTGDGRWLALDARYLKRKQRMLGGLYQSLLRSELSARFGVAFEPIVNGQAEIAGVPAELLRAFSKRAATIELELAARVDEFELREGRAPSRWERAALTRETSADTRARKSGNGAPDLATRWQTEAVQLGWAGAQLSAAIDVAGREAAGNVRPGVTVSDITDRLSAEGSTWGRAEVMQALCDVQRPVAQMPAERWLTALEAACDHIVGRCVDLDPADTTVRRRVSDGRTVWIEPVAPRFTSEAVLVQEEQIVTWAIDAQIDPPAPSTSVVRGSLDPLQAAAAAAVAGHDRLVLVVGPAGAGKTTMLQRAADDLVRDCRDLFGLAPTAKAARVLERDTGIAADTVSKLLHEWTRPDRPPDDDYRLNSGTTVVVDEAGAIGTPALHRLIALAERQRWRLALIGDPLQLQAVGRGGMFHELCAGGRVEQLEHLHRFTHPWEAAASLKLRRGDPTALDAYQAHDRIVAGTLDEHLAQMATVWIDAHRRGDTVALVASTNDHVDAINHAVQAARLTTGDLNGHGLAFLADGDLACIGDIVATRRNHRRLITTEGEPVRNRETWTITAVHDDGAVTVTQQRGHGTVTLPADYVDAHVRLGYAATEHGYQSDTVTTSIGLATSVTTRRGLYVAATRGRDENLIFVITDSHDIAEARDVLDGVVAVDRADVPAVTQRRELARQASPVITRQPQRPVQQGRCQIPDWFPPLLADARRELVEAEQSVAARSNERVRREAALAAAQRELARVDEATRPHRDALAADQTRATQARRAYEAAERRLGSVGRRGRREARRELDIAERIHERADAILERTQQRTAHHLESYDRARRAVEDAGTNLYHRDLAAQLDGNSRRLPGLQRLVAALDTWQHWSNGDTIDTKQILEAAHVLIRRDAKDHRGQCEALGDTLREWSKAAGLISPSVRRETIVSRDIARPDLGFGIEL